MKLRSNACSGSASPLAGSVRAQEKLKSSPYMDVLGEVVLPSSIVSLALYLVLENDVLLKARMTINDAAMDDEIDEMEIMGSVDLDSKTRYGVLQSDGVPFIAASEDIRNPQIMRNFESAQGLRALVPVDMALPDAVQIISYIDQEILQDGNPSGF